MKNQWINELSDLTEVLQPWVDLLLHLLVIIVFLIFIWLCGKIVKSFVNYMPKISADAKNSINLLISVGQIFVATLGVFSLLGADEDFILGVSTIVAAVIGIASASVASNVFGGLYLIITRPFTVGDLIKTEEAIGIVEEIGLNFTKIIQIDRTSVIIPNSRLLSASLLNYSTQLPTNDDRKGIIKTLDSINIIPVDFYHDRYTKYRSLIEFQLSVINPPISIEDLKQRLNRICEKFSTVYGIQPSYYFGKYDFRQKVYLVITAPDAYTIFNSWPYLMESIAETVFAELQESRMD
ncbi:MAG: mechanosensitive ion channel [Candidatus Heimdallarchaeota archaeon]|nr:MAG: mechanosensitive ion channel [Candidatus Heimdallarchaeota archaeon]